MINLKLIPNPIPPEAHGRNLRSMLPKDDWDLIRMDAYNRAGYVCEICGGTGKKHPVECHEEWEFDTQKKTQKLVKILAICPECHKVKHILRTIKTGSFVKSLKHFCKVNELTLANGEMVLRDLLNSQMLLLGVKYKVDIELAKQRLLELYDEKEKILNAFPIRRK